MKNATSVGYHILQKKETKTFSVKVHLQQDSMQLASTILVDTKDFREFCHLVVLLIHLLKIKSFQQEELKIN